MLVAKLPKRCVMKVIFFLFTSLIVVATFVVFLVFAPYHFYYVTLNEGLISEYLTLKRHDSSWHKTSVELSKGGDTVFSESTDLWRDFHFSNFNLPFPLLHPSLLVVPYIDFEGSYDELGARFLDRGEQELAEFLILQSESYELTQKKQKLFELPYFRAHLREKTPAQIWQDMFTLDLDLEGKGNRDWTTYLQELYKIDYRDLVYKLYILKMREHYFPVNTDKFAFYKDTGVAIIDLKNDDESYKDELFFILEKDIIYKIKFRYNVHNIMGEVVREKILQSIRYQESSEDSTNAIYAQYKQLEYEERIDQKGMVYLYAAWSHVPKKKEFLKEMIRFLERGKGNQVYLRSLYDYAYKLYGTNFSLDKDNLKESSEERLKRLIKKESDEEYEAIGREKLNIDDTKFENREQKIDFLLQKAKDNNENLDEKDNVLRSH